MENKEIVISEREKELGSHVSKVIFIGCKKSEKSDNYYELDLVQSTPYRKKYNNGYSMLHLYPKKDSMPKVLIPLGAEVDAVFLNVPEGQKPVLLRFEGLERFDTTTVQEVASIPAEQNKIDDIL